MKAQLRQIVIESGYLGLIKRGVIKSLREYKKVVGFTKDYWLGTYQPTSFHKLNVLMNSKVLHEGLQSYALPLEVIKHYLNHSFDLLGSGWVQLSYGMQSRGLEQHRYQMAEPVKMDNEGHWLTGRINPSNLKHAQRIWRLVDEDYQPIDWQLDFKSGYRWSEKVSAKKIKIGHQPGVDVKVPWELSRMQHLPQLALACLGKELNEETIERIQKEYRNQILDFIATNPPSYGVNWVCPMDVAIRAANWLVAWDVWNAKDKPFDPHFVTCLSTSIYEHGLFIFKNLEKNEPKGNHYLANLVGLVYIAAYLPATEETDGWLLFAVKELMVEVKRQFYHEGTNVEGSTAYHRLSTEMVYYATSILLSIQKSPRILKNSISFPKVYFDHLEKMANFIKNITKPDGTIPQIGDNDSGRFLKLAPIYDHMSIRQAKESYNHLDGYVEFNDDESYWIENQLDCRHLLHAAAELFSNPYELQSQNHADAVILRSLINNIPKKESVNKCSPSYEIGDESVLIETIAQFKTVSDHTVLIERYAISGSWGELNLCSYPQFGLYLIQSSRLYLAIRCWSGGQPQYLSHRHQDQLSVELSIDGRDLIVDPGTYLYTPIPNQRHLYRSHTAHYSPFFKDKPPCSTFGPILIEPVVIDYYGKKGFAAGTVDKQNQLVISLLNNWVEIYRVDRSIKTNESPNKIKLLFSPGYGIQKK